MKCRRRLQMLVYRNSEYFPNAVMQNLNADVGDRWQCGAQTYMKKLVVCLCGLCVCLCVSSVLISPHRRTESRGQLLNNQPFYTKMNIRQHPAVSPSCFGSVFTGNDSEEQQLFHCKHFERVELFCQHIHGCASTNSPAHIHASSETLSRFFQKRSR